MKKVFASILILAFVLVLLGCYSARSVSSTVDNVGYLQFKTSNGGEKIIVTVDGERSIEAIANKSSKAMRNGNTYAIETGAHQISVVYQGAEILNKTVMISIQEINVVGLPL